MAMDRRDAWRGAVLGQCLGDALGFPLEGFPPADALAYVEQVLGTGHAGEVARPGTTFGQYTDDSQLLRELLLSAVERGRFEPADAAGRIERLFSTGRVVGGGRATIAAANRLAAGVPWTESGEPAPSAGNGAAMRAAAIALIHPDDPEWLVRATVEQAQITHRDPRAIAGAVAVSATVARALRPGPVDAPSLCAEIAPLVARVDGSVADVIRRIPEWIPLHPPEAFEHVAVLGDRGVGQQWQGVSPFVTSSVAWSLYSFLKAPEDFWQVVRCAIAVGGDVDTTAAMAGAMVGARVGLSGLPDQLVRAVHDRGAFGFDELVALADRAFDLAHFVGA